MITMLRAILAVMALVATALALWIAVPSAIFFTPLSLSLDGENLTFVRATDFGDVTVTWVGEITLIDQDGFECAGSGTRIAQVEPGGIVTGRIGTWARPCIEAGPPFILRYQYQVWVLGMVPLRPVGISIKVEGV